MHGWLTMAHTAKSIAIALIALVGVALPGGAGAQDANGSIELVDPNVFRACADPHALPFSNEAGKGSKTKSRRCSRTNSASRLRIRSIPTPRASFATR